MREESTTIEVGHKDGRVVINFFGTSEVQASYVALSPSEAREMGRRLLACADKVEKLQ